LKTRRGKSRGRILSKGEGTEPEKKPKTKEKIGNLKGNQEEKQKSRKEGKKQVFEPEGKGERGVRVRTQLEGNQADRGKESKDLGVGESSGKFTTRRTDKGGEKKVENGWGLRGKGGN